MTEKLTLTPDSTEGADKYPRGFADSPEIGEIANNAQVERSLNDIAQVQERVTASLGLEAGSPQAVAETDSALIHIAENSLLGTEQGLYTPEAIEDVVIEGALEGVGLKDSTEKNPIVVLELDGHGDQIDKVVAELHASHAELPNHTSAAEAVVAVMEGFQYHEVMQQGESGVEYLEAAPEPDANPEREKSPQNLAERIESAMQASEFQRSPEVEKAIGEYYTEQYRFADVIEGVIDKTLTEADMAQMLTAGKAADNIQIKEAISRLLSLNQDPANRGDCLRAAHDVMQSALFTEVCVGALTTGEDEVDLKKSLSEKLIAAALYESVAFSDKGDQIYWSEATSSKTQQPSFGMNALLEGVKQGQDRVKKQFWQDSRFAGQLEFHNTPDILSITGSQNILMTRTRQKQNTGDYRATTLDTPGHSESIHFSEAYMTDGYKEVLGNGRKIDSNGEELLPGTIAIPLAEVVKTTPYARGGEYGTLELKDAGAQDKVLIKDEVIATTDERWYHNAGTDDNSPSETGLDRTFYANNSQTGREANYQYNFGRDMATETGNASHVLLLQRDIDRIKQTEYMKDGRSSILDRISGMGSGYGMPNVTTLQFDYDRPHGHGTSYGIDKSPGVPLIPEKYRHVGIEKSPVGLFPEGLEGVAGNHNSYRPDITQQQQQSELEAAISDMQQISINMPGYRGRAVVRLRGNSMQFQSRA